MSAERYHKLFLNTKGETVILRPRFYKKTDLNLGPVCFVHILNKFALLAHVGILILDRNQGLCRIINSFTVTRFYFCHFVFIFGAERLKTDSKIRNIIIDFFLY